MAKTILIIDDEKSIRASLSAALEDEGYHVLSAASGQEGIECVKNQSPHLIILDIWMPEMDGVQTLTKIKETHPDLPILMMSGHGTIETAVKAIKMGAYDFIEKPLSLERLLVLAQNALKTQDLATENKVLRKQVEKRRSLIGESSAMNKLKEMIKKVAPTTGSVLITGENGTGKELVAHSIHALSPRFNKPFIEVNCAAIPEELIESELFGHEKGAFTGATQLRRGKFDLAHGGTLFLDEIGDMSVKTQAKVLRILQEQKFERVGGSETITVDVRVVAATNKDLKAEIKRGNFREDLYYRLNVVPFSVPPLRERKEDIKALSLHFLSEFCSSHGKKSRLLTPEAVRVLEEYPWPGNVRELKNLIERVLILTGENEEGLAITPATLFEHLNDSDFDGNEVTGVLEVKSTLKGGTSSKKLKDARHDFEKEYISKILEANEWNVSKTATVLGVERSHLHKKIKAFGLDEKAK